MGKWEGTKKVSKASAQVVVKCICFDLDQMVEVRWGEVRCLFCAFCCSQRRKERKQQRRLQRLNHQGEEEGEAQNARKRIRRELMPSATRLVLDCSFDNLMPIKVNSWGISAEGMPYICKLKSALCLSWHQQSSCVFRMYESFTNRSSAAMLWTGEPYIQCRLVTAVTRNVVYVLSDV